jgi:thiol-disulfide isomerase/thioredoxin
MNSKFHDTFAEWGFPIVIALAIGALFLLFQRRWSSVDAQRLGKQAPNIEFRFSDGTSSSIAKLKGTVLLLHFWAGWCDPCKDEMPTLSKLERAFTGQNFRILAFNVEDSPESTEPWGSDLPHPKHFIFDYPRPALDPYEVNAIPESILVDKVGRIRDVFVGPQDWDDRSLRREIEEMVR